MPDLLNDTLSRALRQFIGCNYECVLQSQESLRNPPNQGAVVLILNPVKNIGLDLASQAIYPRHHFAVLPSHSSPRLLLPIGNLSCSHMGAQIYTPYAPIAQMMKRLLVRTIRTGWRGWARHRVLLASRQPLPIEDLVASITGEPSPVFALSLGNQLAVSKLTVQVMRQSGEILGYVKLPLTNSATDRLRHEAAVLERLWSLPALRPHIPRLLHAGHWEDSYILFQSPLPGEAGPADFSSMHEDFLRRLWKVHRVEQPGHVLIDRVGAKWNKAVVRLGPKWKELGREALLRSTQHFADQLVTCGISHGDFAPWNTRVHEKRLLLFDWESSDWETPISWDIFHFGLQTAIAIKKNSEPRFPSLGKANGELPYLLYLLNSVVQFLEEDNWIAIDYRRELLLRELKGTPYVLAENLADKKQPAPSTHRKGFCVSTLVTAPQRGLRIVTTSWDDGDPLDMRLAELLRSRGLTGTFYIPISGYLGNTTIPVNDLRALSAEGFEIGAHGVSHNSLTLFRGKKLQDEVKVCKQKLEQLIGTEVSTFCYPNGRYNADVIREVKLAGYKGARTTRMFSRRLSFGSFEMPTTLQAHPHTRSHYLKNLVRARSAGGSCEYLVRFSRIDSWLTLAKRLFDLVMRNGGMWHLYGHSWEIDQFGIWSDLREMLDYISNREGVMYVTNQELLKLMNSGRVHL